jgi:hypothetical protein
MDARPMLAVALVAMLLLPGCASTNCPTSADDLLSDEFQAALGPDHVAGVAMVARFVDSPDSEYRGYDVALEGPRYGALTWRSRDIQTFLAVLTDERPEISQGDRVTFVGSMGEGRATIYPVCFELLQEAP